MGKPAQLHRLMLASLLAIAAMPAGCSEQATLRRFDVPRQPAAAGLNEFARQADITLVFSYDLVAHAVTGELRGRYSINQGLGLLLTGTGLGYQQVGQGVFTVCGHSSCSPDQSGAGNLHRIESTGQGAAPGKQKQKEAKR
jgi:hypothetical protein